MADQEMVANQTSRILRFIADSYEQAQRIRIETGERIRAVLQGRDETWEADPEWQERNAAVVLKEIVRGDHLGPVSILGRTYRRHAEEEAEMKAAMTSALTGHPAWPWMEKVRGIGPTLACKLLARLDPEKADHASSFWAYCGLATVPGEKYRCPECGLERTFPQGFKVTGRHMALGTTKRCKSSIVLVSTPEDGVRAAQPRPSKGHKAAYDQYAKKIMYLVGSAFLKAGGPYEELYRKERARLDRERPGWADGRKHLTAMRKTEKLFLSHLWQVWRTEVGLPTPDPYAMAHLGHTDKIEPWDMVEN